MAIGRKLTTSQLVFEEDPSTVPVGERPKTMTIMVDGDDLTQDRVLKIADSDGYLNGLRPGEGWATTKGGTGLINWPKDTFAVGSGTDITYTTNAPANQGDMLFFDKDVTGKWQSAPMDLSGIEATSARNLTTTYGVYSSKLGSELRFKGIGVSGGALTIIDDGQRISLGLNMSTQTINASQVTGTFGPSQGGTGRTSTTVDGLLVGAAGNTYDVITPPTAAGQILTSNGPGLSWKVQSLDDGFPGGLDYPIEGTQIINIKWPYAVNLKELVTATNTGGAVTVSLIKNSESLGTANATSAIQSVSLAGKTLNQGDVLKLTLTNVSAVTRLDYTINYTRVQ